MRTSAPADLLALVAPGALAEYSDALEVILCGQVPVAMGTLALTLTMPTQSVSVNTCRSTAAACAVWNPK